MSARERARTRRMTQAAPGLDARGHAASVAGHVDAQAQAQAHAAAGAVLEDEPQLVQRAELDRAKVRAAMAELRATPRLAQARAASPLVVVDAATDADADAECSTSALPTLPSFPAYRHGDPARRLLAERELDLESFPRRVVSPPDTVSPLAEYFVVSGSADGGSSGVELTPKDGLDLHPHPQPNQSSTAALSLRNSGEVALCVNASLSHEAHFALRTPMPCFLFAGGTLAVEVCCTGSVTSGATAATADLEEQAQLVLWLKPLLAGEEERAHASLASLLSLSAAAAEEAQALWSAAPHRIMQKIIVPLRRANNAAVQNADAATESAAPAAAALE